MASPTPSKSAPTVQHNFGGDSRVLNATFERRKEVREALTALAQDLQRIEGCPTQVKAEIKLQVGGYSPKEHVYKISITDQGSDAIEFARAIPQPGLSCEKATNSGAASSPQIAGRANGQQVTPVRSTPRVDADDELMDIRPFKRQKTASEATSAAHSQQDSRTFAQPPEPARFEDAMTYLRNWHQEWTQQGGWLYDTLTKTSNNAFGMRGSIDKKMDSVQDVLGQSINASSASTIAELGSITKLVHWLEHCRKTSADKVQAREEKWRSSSATFHDQTRREREAAEKRIERKLDEQNELLMKLARANNIDASGVGQSSGESNERSREESLGAQLTAELNMEAGRRGDKEDEPFTIND